MSGEDGEQHAELVTFSVKEAYVYTPIPPATSYGHRAELWDVEKWQFTVRLKLVTVGDECLVRLEQQETGELFAECPLPSDGSSLTRAVEPVVDSSRYYVLRLASPEDDRQHAFVGLGFRERGESSAFSAALDEYRQYLRRKREAAELRAAHEQQLKEEGEAGAEGGAEGKGPAGSTLALQPGQTLNIKLSFRKPGGKGSSSTGSTGGTAGSLVGGMGGLRLAPPPSSSSSTSQGQGLGAAPLLAPPPAAAASSVPSFFALAAQNSQQQQPQPQQQAVAGSGPRRVSGEAKDWAAFPEASDANKSGSSSGTTQQAAAAASSALPASSGQGQGAWDPDWGDFQS